MKIRFNDKINELKNFCLERKKQFILGSALVLSGALAVGAITSNNKNDVVIENEIGYEDINTTFNGLKNVFGKGVKENEFVILNVGDSKEYGVFNQDKKIKYCNEKDIALGIIVSPTSIYEHDIYDDVELVRGLINENDIDFPVYLDINDIMENYNINNASKIDIIRTFMNKCTSNGIYVGVYGTDTNLQYLSKYCDINEYDAFLVMDNENIGYTGTYNVVKDLEGNITSKTNLEYSICEKGLNEKDRLKNDGLYTVQEGDILLDIAMKHNLSPNALLKYNDMKEKDFVPGITIRIPSVIENVIPSNIQNTSYEVLDEPIRGADFSHFQDNKNMDWDLIKKNFDYVILKCSEGTTDIDGDFNEFSTKCALYDIPYGAYCLNAKKGIKYNNNEDFLKALNSQADTCLNMIENKNIELPVYLDIEGGSDIVSKQFTKEQITMMLDNWYERIESMGYIPGLYCSDSTFKYISEFYDISKFETWVAKYKYGDTKISLDKTPIPEYNSEIGIHQTSQSTIDVGAPVEGHGVTDIDYSYIDYTKPINKENMEYSDDLIIKDIDRSFSDSRNISLLIQASGVCAVGCAIYFAKNKKKRH